MRRHLMLAALGAAVLVPPAADAATPTTGASWFGFPDTHRLGETAAFWWDARLPFTIQVPGDWVDPTAFDGADPEKERDELMLVTIHRAGQNQDRFGYIEARDCAATPPYERGKWSLQLILSQGCVSLDASITTGGFLQLTGTLPPSSGDARFRYMFLHKGDRPWSGRLDRPRKLSIETSSGKASIVGVAYPAIRVTVSRRSIVEGQTVTVRLRNAPPREVVDLVEKPRPFDPFGNGSWLGRNSPTDAHGVTNRRGRLVLTIRPRMSSNVVAFVAGKKIRPGMRALQPESRQLVEVHAKPPRVIVRPVAGSPRTYNVEFRAAPGSSLEGLSALAWTVDARGRKVQDLGGFALSRPDTRRTRVTLGPRERAIIATAQAGYPRPRDESRPTRVALG